MAKHQVTLTSLGLFNVPPEKRVNVSSDNEGHSSPATFTSFELKHPYDIGEVYQIAYSLTDIEK